MLHRLEIDGKTYSLKQLRFELRGLDLISWLSDQLLYPKVFWKEKTDRIVRVAVGNLLSFPQVPHIKSDVMDVRLYGGMRFAQKRENDETWRGFPQVCFWLPHIEVSQAEGKTEVIVNSLNEKMAFSEPEQWDFREGHLDFAAPSLLGREEMPDFSLWQKNIDVVLGEIAAGRMDKLVLARKTSLHLSKPVPVWPLLNQLNEKATGATVFAFQLSPGLCFLGATPEKLFQRSADWLRTEAVAATRPRGKTAEEDLQLEKELLSDAKEQREFKCVSAFLDEALRGFSEEIRWEGQDKILKSSHVQHIYNQLAVKLKHEVSNRQLIETLHPTPALGGFPRSHALPLLKKIEPFDRGWYGAPIGFICPQNTHLYVGIRSGLIRNRSLHLFAGTGIVQGSVAEREWEELEQKMRPFLELFKE